MRVRTIELRILGVALTALWAAAFLLVLLGYRPGGPVDLAVGLAAIGPIVVAFGAVVWPPVARGDRAFAAIAWLALGAILLLVPSLTGLITQLEGRGPQTLLPSFEAAYPWLLALLATGLFAGLGIAPGAWARRRSAAGGSWWGARSAPGSCWSPGRRSGPRRSSTSWRSLTDRRSGRDLGPRVPTSRSPSAPPRSARRDRPARAADGQRDRRPADGKLRLEGIRNGAHFR